MKAEEIEKQMNWISFFPSPFKMAQWIYEWSIHLLSTTIRSSTLWNVQKLSRPTLTHYFFFFFHSFFFYLLYTFERNNNYINYKIEEEAYSHLLQQLAYCVVSLFSVYINGLSTNCGIIDWSRTGICLLLLLTHYAFFWRFSMTTPHYQVQ